MKGHLPPSDPRRTTHARLDFLSPLAKYHVEKPYYNTHHLPAAEEGYGTNIEFASEAVPVLDIRGAEQDTDLDRNKFEFLQHKSRVQFSLDGHAAEEEKVCAYLDETVAWVEERLQPEFCLAYSHVFRKALATPKPAAMVTGSQLRPDQPANDAHVDQTQEGGYRRVAHQLTKEQRSRYISSGRYRLRIINVWRPLHHVADTHPLAFCDPHSIDKNEELAAADHISSGYRGEIYYLYHKTHQKWYWLSGTTPEEVVMFMSFDSEREYGFVPHASFKNPVPPKNVKLRESLEVRLIVINKL